MIVALSDSFSVELVEPLEEFGEVGGTCELGESVGAGGNSNAEEEEAFCDLFGGHEVGVLELFDEW